MKKIVTAIVLFGLILPLLALAQESGNINDSVDTDLPVVVSESADTDEVTAQDLELTEPKILPNSPWYWAKSLWRSVRLWATFDPLKKAELRLQTANEKLLEIKKLAEQGQISTEQLEKILAKYEKEINKLKEKVEQFKEDKKEQADALMNKITNQEFIRQRLLQKIELKLQNQEQIEKLERIRERSLEKFGDLLNKVQPEKIEQRINQALETDKPLELKNLHNLQVLEELKNKVPQQAQQAIIKAQTNALKRLGESFREMSFEEKVEKVKEFLESSADATTTKQLLEQTEATINNSLPLLPNIINQAKERIQQRQNR